MSQRTSAVQIFTRFWILAFLLGLPFGLPAIVVGVISLPFFAFAALVAALIYNGFMWAGHRVMFSVLFGESEEYRQFRDNGGDPWFDFSCPPPFNNDSEEIRMTGSDEIATRWFCRNCEAEMPDPHSPCPACEFGRWACGRCDALVTGPFDECSHCGAIPRGR